MRLLVFTDYVYRERDGAVYAERAFALFLGALAEHVDGLTIVGRLDPRGGASRYPLPAAVRFVALPYYQSLAHPVAVAGSLPRGLRRFWRALAGADCVWLLGPQPHALLFAALARGRGRRVVLGVRQDYPTYVRSRRPERRWMHHAADLLELAWRVLARRCPVVVVGPELESQYGHARRLLPITVSLISAADVDAGAAAGERPYDGELRVLSVGRLDHEKNPLLLADVLARLRATDPRWRLIVYGEGPLQPDLESRLAELGIAENADLCGYVPLHDGLLDAYRASHAFLHVSLTEGLPQVLIEAFASGTPVVATAVGGVPAAVGDAALLIPPADATAAADAILRTAAEAPLRRALVDAGLRRAREHTLAAEAARVAAFLAFGVSRAVS